MPTFRPLTYLLGICICWSIAHPLHSQNIIGGETGDSSAILELQSTDKGLLIPRMTSSQRSAIASPAPGLMIFNTTLNCLEINLGSSGSPDWLCMLGGGKITSLDCNNANSTGSLFNGVEASGVSSSIPYTGGNGGYHPSQSASSTGVTGLTATLIAGAFAEGNDSLTYTITGTPSAAGTASFELNIGGQSCTLQLTVEFVCGAFVADGVWKIFMCHNLGANTSADPFVPSWELIGNYYQWGRNPSCFGRDGVDDANPCSSPVYGASGPWGTTTANDNAGTIPGWSTTAAADGSWSEGSKTANDPCPAGFRVPTLTQLTALTNNTLNPRTLVGTWTSSTTNYRSGYKFGTSLLLSAAGARTSSTGGQNNRGIIGGYWSTTMDTSTFAKHLFFGNTSVSVATSSRNNALPVRCIAE